MGLGKYEPTFSSTSSGCSCCRWIGATIIMRLGNWGFFCWWGLFFLVHFWCTFCSCGLIILNQIKKKSQNVHKNVWSYPAPQATGIDWHCWPASKPHASGFSKDHAKGTGMRDQNKTSLANPDANLSKFWRPYAGRL